MSAPQTAPNTFTQAQLLNDLQATKDASYSLQDLSEDKIQAVLNDFADALLGSIDTILTENKKDLSKMDAADPLYDRLLLNEERLQAIASDIKKVALLPTPVDQIIEQRTLPNDADLKRIRVPIGVINVIYEARPNVTMDVFSLCFRTQNACVLRGGTDAHHSNLQTVSIIHQVLKDHGISPEIVYLMPPEREFMPTLLQAHGLVDMCIPRGSQGLIDFVRENASIPVIETGRGVVHVYFDKDGDITKGNNIIVNAKTRRVSVCNALDTLIVHEDRLSELETLLNGLSEKGVHILADTKAKEALSRFYPKELTGEASADTLDEEFMALKMNLVTVGSALAAIAHIKDHGSGHTESVITEEKTTERLFLRKVDASVVMANTSTAFSDGGEFGLGAEIGISTQKLHARGPMGLEPLTTYKWVMTGNGQIR